MKAIGELFKLVVEPIQNEVGQPYYIYEHILGVVNTLKEMDTQQGFKNRKYPLIALILDSKEILNYDSFSRTATFSILIATQTKPEYKAHERTEKSFNAVLYPLLEKLIQSIEQSGVMQLVGDFEKYDRYNWGKEGIYGNVANIFEDYIDAIELKNVNVKILNNCQL